MSEDLKFCNHQYRGHDCFGTRLIDTVVVPAVTDELVIMLLVSVAGLERTKTAVLTVTNMLMIFVHCFNGRCEDEYHGSD